MRNNAMLSAISTAAPPPDASQESYFFHDGCKLCLDIARTLAGIVPALIVINLGVQPERVPEAMARGVAQLPSLVAGSRVLPIEPHSDIGHIGAV